MGLNMLEPQFISSSAGEDRQNELSSETRSSGEKMQWTIKSLDKDTVEASKKAAQKRGMKISAWVEQELRKAAYKEISNGGKGVDEFDNNFDKILHVIKKMSDQHDITNKEIHNINQTIGDVVKAQHKIMSNM